MSQAADLEVPIYYLPNGTLPMQIDWNPDDLSPGPYLLDTKWCRFSLKLKEDGPVVWEATDSGSYISFDQTGVDEIANIAIPFDAINEQVGSSETLQTILQAQDSVLYACDFGDVADADLVEMRFQGTVRALPSHGNFSTGRPSGCD